MKIGSTLKGIGPAYTDKTSRSGLRTGELLKDNFHEIYTIHRERHLKILQNYEINTKIEEYEKEWFEGIELLKKFRIINTEYYINKSLNEEKEYWQKVPRAQCWILISDPILM